MMRGMSREKPALDLERWMARAWSPYERMGERAMKTGARMPTTDVIQLMAAVG